MLKRLAHVVAAVVHGQTAQASVEYALVVSVTVALLVGISGVVLNALSTYYVEVTSVVCLPIP